MELEKWEQTLHASPWRTTKGAAPDAVKAARTVLNGEDEETYARYRALRLPNGNVDVRCKVPASVPIIQIVPLGEAESILNRIVERRQFMYIDVVGFLARRKRRGRL